MGRRNEQTLLLRVHRNNLSIKFISIETISHHLTQVRLGHAQKKKEME